jgi:hypothetical protein
MVRFIPATILAFALAMPAQALEPKSWLESVKSLHTCDSPVGEDGYKIHIAVAAGLAKVANFQPEQLPEAFFLATMTTAELIDRGCNLEAGAVATLVTSDRRAGRYLRISALRLRDLSDALGKNRDR